MLQFSLKKKVPLSKVCFKAFYLISMDMINKEEEGFCISSIILSNCFYDYHSNLLIEEKDKQMYQSIPTLYLLPEITEVNLN
jgi:hypothetical protein